MENPQAVVPLAQVRERVIQQLTEAFANDLITIEELEGRLDHVYRAQSAAEAEALVVGLRPVTPNAPRDQTDFAPRRNVGLSSELVPVHDRFVSILSSSSRSGSWSVPHQFDVVAAFTYTVIDLTGASLPGDIVDMNIKAFAASLKIIVPPGLRVVNRVGVLLGHVSTDTALDLAPMVPGSPVIRITGFAMLSSVEIVAGSTTGENA